MSEKNKAKDRDENGRIKRRYTRNHKRLKFDSVPKGWVNLFMTRPRRRVEKELCRRLVRMQAEDCEGVFPLGNHKPHIYYL